MKFLTTRDEFKELHAALVDWRDGIDKRVRTDIFKANVLCRLNEFNNSSMEDN